MVKDDGLVVVMFTHRSLSAWEELLESLIEAGLYASASFPVHTEMEAGMFKLGKGMVKSAILLSCRKRLEQKTGYFHEVRRELVRNLRERLDAFWYAGVRGADFFISAIGPAVEIYGRYGKVSRPDGKEITIGEWLEEVHRLVADHALERLDGLGQVDEATRFYILWRWAYGGASLEFDDARKLSIGVGADLEALRRSGLIWGRDVIYLPTALERCKDAKAAKALVKSFEEGQIESEISLIDAIHTGLILWDKAEEEDLGQFLLLSGMDKSEAFWHTCQALLEVEEDWLRRGASSKGREEEEAEEGEEEEGKGRGGGAAVLAKEATLLRQFLSAREGLLRRARREGEQMRLL